jgi:hypothetical protein
MTLREWISEFSVPIRDGGNVFGELEDPFKASC